MLEQVRKTIDRYEMLKPGDRILIAVSGGVDSVVLLHALRELQESRELFLAMAHFDHAIRPDSAQDARFVAHVARQLQLKYYTGCADVPVYAKAKKCSLEVAARELRYRFLERTARAHRITRIALGHNLNDQAETLLMRLLRGTGPEGLIGIAPVRTGPYPLCYVRPLLECTRQQIEEYAREHGLRWREDSSNCDTRILRNRIRHELLPILTRDYNPNLLKTLGRTARLLSQAVAHLQIEAELALPSVMLDVQCQKIALDANELLALSPFLQSLIVRRAIQMVRGLREIESAHLEPLHEWLSRGSSGELQLPGGLRLLRRHNLLIVTTQATTAPNRYEYPLALPGETVIPEINWRFSTTLMTSPHLTRQERGAMRKTRIFVDADKMQYPLVVRNRRPGDYIRLKEGTKKLQDLFVDKKIPREARDTTPLICDADALIWIVGECMNEDYRVTSKTRRILHIAAQETEGAP